MSLIDLKFHPIFEDPILNGTKWLTTRREPRGVGDTFEAFGKMFKISMIRPHSLGYVRAVLWKQSGCKNSFHFHQTWKEIYGTFDSDLQVFTHQFEPVSMVS